MRSQALVLAVACVGAFAQNAPAPNNTITSSTTLVPSSSSPAGTTLSLLLGRLNPGFVGSIVDADPCGTTVVALACTASDSCDDDTVTATFAPSTFMASMVSSDSGFLLSFSTSCSIYGPSASADSAVCAVTASASDDGQSTSLYSTSYTIPGVALTYQPVPITANVQALASATAACHTAVAGARPTAVSEVYKVIVPVGAALIARALI